MNYKTLKGRHAQPSAYQASAGAAFSVQKEKVHSDSEEEKEKRKYTQLSRAIALKKAEIGAMDAHFEALQNQYVELCAKLRDFSASYIKTVESLFYSLETP